MGEVKSTLDLVMERTRNMLLSAEEKVKQQRIDFEKRLNGLLNKYADRALSVDEFMNQIAKLQAELKSADPQLVAGAVLARINPDFDNQRWLELINSLTPFAKESLQKILASHDKQQAELLQAATKRQMEQLARHHGIKGSAVAPNIEKDMQYKKHLAALQFETKEKVESISK